MTLCPYKWFLYLASIWAVAYVMLEAYVQYRTAETSIQKQPYEQECANAHAEEDSDEEEEEEEGVVKGEGKGWGQWFDVRKRLVDVSR